MDPRLKPIGRYCAECNVSNSERVVRRVAQSVHCVGGAAFPPLKSSLRKLIRLVCIVPPLKGLSVGKSKRDDVAVK